MLGTKSFLQHSFFTYHRRLHSFPQPDMPERNVYLGSLQHLALVFEGTVTWCWHEAGSCFLPWGFLVRAQVRREFYTHRARQQVAEEASG